MGKVKAFLDTNILVDLLSAEPRPSTQASTIIFEMARRRYLEVVVTIQSVIDAAYIIRHSPNSLNTMRDKLTVLQRYVNFESLDFFNLQDALQYPSPDFEDCAQYFHACSAFCDFLVTSDRKFKSWHGPSEMIVFTPEEFVERMMDMPLEQSPANKLTPERRR